MLQDTKFDICNRALVSAGCNTIASFDDGTTEAISAALFYQSEVTRLISKHPWRFAKTTADLDLIDEDAPGEWAAVWQIPTDVWRVLELTASGAGVASYDMQADRIACDVVDYLKLVYLRQVGESYFPPHFVTALEARLRYRFAFSISRQATMAKEFKTDAMVELRDAKYIDATQTPAIRIRPTRFTGARL